MHVSIYTQLSVVINYHEIHHTVLGKNDSDHCLSSCTVWSLGFLSGLSLYRNNIFIENSFCVVLSKSQCVKLLSKSKRWRPLEPSLLRDHFTGFFETVPTIFKHYTPHSSVIYSWLTFLRSFSFHILSKTSPLPLRNRSIQHDTIKFKPVKVLTVWTWQLIDKFFVLYRTFDWLDLKNVGFYCYVTECSVCKGLAYHYGNNNYVQPLEDIKNCSAFLAQIILLLAWWPQHASSPIWGRWKRCAELRSNTHIPTLQHLSVLGETA